MKAAIERFACTQCGKCCNRPPEVALSEAAALCDAFVFMLMFRLYWLPRVPGDSLEFDTGAANAGAAFYQKKRLLAAFAARKYPTRIWRDGKAVAYTKYLTISALALDTSTGGCSALEAGRCGIYERRPLACRTAPFHYSRVEASAGSDLKAFVETPGFGCDTSDGADVVLEGGRIVDAGTLAARAEAVSIAGRDRRWSEAIVRRMNAGSPAEAALPSLDEVEANASLGATTISMRFAWQIAADCGLMSREECATLIAAQLAAIDRELEAGRCTQEARETLAEMRADYRHVLNDDRLAFVGNGWPAEAHRM